MPTVTWTEGEVVAGTTGYTTIGLGLLPVGLVWQDGSTGGATYAECATPAGSYAECATPSATYVERNL
jgi:hypothetical protein